MRTSTFLLAFFLALPTAAQDSAAQRESYDYWRANRELVQRGVQAVLMCNGLFTSDRSLEQVFDQELAYLRDPIGTADGGDYTIDWERRGVSVGDVRMMPGAPATANGESDYVPTIHAAFREGFGCVVLAPDQDLDDVESLPSLDLPPPAGNPLRTPWPMGDLVEDAPLASGINAAALQAASDWAFDRPTPEQVTLSLLVVHKGRIVHERYAPGVDMYTRTRTWSTAKSIAVTLMGMLVDAGRMSLDEPLDVEWLPRAPEPESDPRREITLRHVLNMSSGLYPVDDRGLEYATGSGLAYWAGASSANGARNRAIIRKPGTSWNYENYDTLLGVLAMKNALGDEAAYHAYPRRALLDRIGMRNTLLSVDRFGDFVLSSQVYTNARDLARFGMLYLNDGVWMGERLLSSEWIGFVRTPAPSTAATGNFYGGQWWLVPDSRKGGAVPDDAYSTAGNRGQFVIVVPSHDLVIVRRGLDYGRQGFDRWELLSEVLKAFE